LWTDVAGEFIMARTPSAYAVEILEKLGPWAKPFAVTGGLATIGFLLWLAYLAGLVRRWLVIPAIAAIAWGASEMFDYVSIAGQLSFWLPAGLVLLGRLSPIAATPSPARREVLARGLPLLMGGSTALVAIESYWRNQQAARHAVTPIDIAPFLPPPETFAPSLVRKAVTPVPEFYVMSKNAVDPSLDPAEWRLRITLDGAKLREFRYADLLSLRREERYVTLRCISNTLKSNLMGTAYWSGISVSQLIDPSALPRDIVEMAVIGVDGHGDSFPLDYATSGDVLLALGMNGKTLNRDHGFPLRLLAPRYYGFKNVKWIGEIGFVSKPYFGTWPKMGYTKDARIHTTSFIDRVRRGGSEIGVYGVSFAGDRGVRAVQVRADQGAWTDAVMEPPLSRFAWTRWRAEIASPAASIVEARAMDGTGEWQATKPTDLFPSGVKGPTVRRLS